MKAQIIEKDGRPEFAVIPYVPPPIFNEPILFFLGDPVKVAGFEIYGVDSADIGAIQGTAMGGQQGYWRAGSLYGSPPSNTPAV